ncbi:autoinducer binding domain-containing protein [Pelagibacterium halotolerans]|uniref:autoinducer binding domain-containing protein n=1 Tax=Pelagibacterium halotolerans TaxID=531813 RepID=UPI00384B22D7
MSFGFPHLAHYNRVDVGTESAMKKVIRPAFDELRDGLPLAGNEGDVKSVLDKFAKRNGFRWFTYLALTPGNIRGISNYPLPWQARCLASDLTEVDPVIANIHPGQGPFTWALKNGVSGHSREQAQFMREAAKFGIRSGISIPVCDGYGRRAAITFSGSAPEVDCSISADQFGILSIGAYLHAYIMHKDDIMLRAADCPLTHIQLEHLSWAAQGKTNADIAAIRGVTARAVEQQFSGARKRIGASTTAQAVAIAVERRWIRV